MIDFVKGSAKAIVGGLTAAIAFAAPVVDDGFVTSEILGTAGAFLVAFGAVYFVENRGPKAPAATNAGVPDARQQPPLW